ncbi:MAG: transcription termination/antitermination NusG family protein [Vicinamibacterales bacterium]
MRRSVALTPGPVDLPAGSVPHERSLSRYPRRSNWYIIHTYSGFEKKVAESLQQRVQAYGLQDEIGEVLDPDRGCGRDAVAVARW